jgi:hypothetical protein
MTELKAMSRVLQVSEDPARIAGRLTREAKQAGERNFNRPLVYAPRGIV